MGVGTIVLESNVITGLAPKLASTVGATLAAVTGDDEFQFYGGDGIAPMGGLKEARISPVPGLAPIAYVIDNGGDDDDDDGPETSGAADPAPWGGSEYPEFPAVTRPRRPRPALLARLVED